MKKIVAAIVVVVLAALAAGIVGVGGGEGGTIKIEVSIDQTFDVSLDYGTDQYQWQLDSFDESVLELVGHEMLPRTGTTEAGEPIVGAGGVEFWTFTAVGAGKTDIYLKYVGVDGSTAKTQTFEVTVIDPEAEEPPSSQEIEVIVGGSIKLTLQFNPSTGCQWELKGFSDPTVLALVSHEALIPPASSDEEPVVGAPGNELWTFKALKAGQSVIYMEYRCPSGEVAQTFVVTVTVKGGGTPTSGAYEVALGTVFTLSLESNPSTGYHWELAGFSDSSILGLVGHEFKSWAADDDEPIVGAPGLELWTFKALKKGESTIFMEYRGPSGELGGTANVPIIVK